MALEDPRTLKLRTFLYLNDVFASDNKEAQVKGFF